MEFKLIVKLEILSGLEVNSKLNILGIHALTRKNDKQN